MKIRAELVESHIIGRDSILGLNCDISKGPWVAGGAARSMIDGSIYRDIDVFFPNMSVYHRHRKDRSNNYFQKFSDKVQYVTDTFYESVEVLISSMDITVCSFVTDGYVVMGSEQAWDDLKNKRLCFNGKVSDQTRSPSRIRKYCYYGFVPDDDTVIESFKAHLLESRYVGSGRFKEDIHDY